MFFVFLIHTNLFFFKGSESNGDTLTVDVVDVVNSNLLVINFLPPKRQFISNTVGKRQRFGDPEMI